MNVIRKLFLWMGFLSGWRWLTLVAGLGLLAASSQSCRSHRKTCYEVVPVDSTVVQPKCYDQAEPVGSDTLKNDIKEKP